MKSEDSLVTLLRFTVSLVKNLIGWTLGGRVVSSSEHV
jgi:hypothetical protein